MIGRQRGASICDPLAVLGQGASRGDGGDLARRAGLWSAAVVSPGLRTLSREALAALGVDHLLLAVHDASFPSAAGEDTGRGSPYSRGALELLDYAAELGFTGAQLGPQGQTSAVNQSPYDGTVFSKNADTSPAVEWLVARTRSSKIGLSESG